MKQRLIIITLLCLGYAGFAQEVISNAGKNEITGSYEISWTLGELIIETAIAGDNILTQGFHQAKMIVTSITKLKMAGVVLKVYPNPTQDFVMISFKDPVDKTQYMLFDIYGKLIKKHTISTNQTKLNMGNMPSGSYVLKIIKNQQVVQNFKIVKQ